MSSSSKSSSYAFEIGSQSGLTKIYNSEIIHAEKVARPKQSPIGLVNHFGVRVTLKNGEKYLIHKGSDYGNQSETIVTSASNMSNEWRVVESIPVRNGMTVGQCVREGGSNYNLFTSNCIHASNAIMKHLGK